MKCPKPDFVRRDARVPSQTILYTITHWAGQANTKEMITEYRCTLLEEVMRKDWKAGSGMACAAARVHFSTRPGLAKKSIHIKKILKVY